MTPALEEALKLLRLALADRDTFVSLIPAVHLRDASVLFPAQQAIEKAFKAVMTAENVPGEAEVMVGRVVVWAEERLNVRLRD